MAGPVLLEYTTRDARGKVVTARQEALDEATLVARLRAAGIAPLAVRRAGGTGLNRELSLPGRTKVTLKDLAIMSRQFATMVSSGLSLLRALSILAEQTASKPLAAVLTTVRQDVEQGSALSSALAKHPRTFPRLMVSMVRAGEVGGFLDAVLLQIAENYEAEVKLRAKIKSAMTYPVVVFAIAVVAVIGMLLFIVPVFAGMFAGLGGTLPLPTRVLVWLSDALKLLALPLVVLGAVGGGVWSRFRLHPRVRGAVDPLKLRLPVFGPLFTKIAISRFTRNLGTMMRSGVPILQSLEIVGATAGNVVIERASEDLQESVRQGGSMTAPLAQHPIFPAMVAQMMAVGEDTGALDTMLTKVADFYDQQVDATADALASLIEPLMIAVLGAIIGGMIIALYMPIFSVFNLIQ